MCNSIYSGEADADSNETKSCQQCHMPRNEPDGQPVRTRIAHNPGGRDFPFLKAREPFGRHTFLGGNLLLTRLMLDHREALEVETPEFLLTERLTANRQFLEQQAATLTLGSMKLGPIVRKENTLTLPVTVANLAGHKLPTAYPSRRIWLRVEVRDQAGDILFCSGNFNELAELIDANQGVLACEEVGGPILPHYRVIRSDKQVQIYQSVMGDMNGEPTFRLLRGASYVKDNRLLPLGCSAEHEQASATRPVGTAGDQDYMAGSDTVTYLATIPKTGLLTVKVSLHYQVLGTRFARELFAIDTPEVMTFRQLYEKTRLQPITLAQQQKAVP